MGHDADHNFTCDCCDQPNEWTDECEVCGHLICEECVTLETDPYSNEITVCKDCES